MPFRHCLALVITIGLACATLYLFVKVFLGHFNVWLGAVPALLVFCIPFIGDWIALIFALQEWSIRQVERIWDWF